VRELYQYGSVSKYGSRCDLTYIYEEPPRMITPNYLNAQLDYVLL
jgi:hypothetical protein